MVDTTLNLPGIPGGKKLIYTNIQLELIPIADLRKRGNRSDACKLAEIVEENNGLWCAEAEEMRWPMPNP